MEINVTEMEMEEFCRYVLTTVEVLHLPRSKEKLVLNVVRELQDVCIRRRLKRLQNNQLPLEDYPIMQSIDQMDECDSLDAAAYHQMVLEQRRILEDKEKELEAKYGS